MDTIDRAWEPLDFDGDRLMAAFPYGAAPLAAGAHGSVWDHPVVRSIQLQHDVAQLQNASKRNRPWSWLRRIARG